MDWSHKQTHGVYDRIWEIEQEYQYLRPRFQRLYDKAYSYAYGLDEGVGRPMSEVYSTNLRSRGKHVGQLTVSSRLYRTHAEAVAEIERTAVPSNRPRYVGWAISPEHVFYNDCVYQKPQLCYRLVFWIVSDAAYPGYFGHCEVKTLLEETVRSIQQYNYLADTDFNPALTWGEGSRHDITLRRWVALYFQLFGLGLPREGVTSGYSCFFKKKGFHSLGSP